MAHVGIVTSEHLGFPKWLYDFRTVIKLLHYCSINLNCCINTWEYLILTMKENCQKDNHRKFEKKLLLQNYVPFSLIFWHSNQANYTLGWGLYVVFSTRGAEFCTEKLSPGRGFWRKKLVSRGLSGGGGNWSKWYPHKFLAPLPILPHSQLMFDILIHSAHTCRLSRVCIHAAYKTCSPFGQKVFFYEALVIY